MIDVDYRIYVLEARIAKLEKDSHPPVDLTEDVLLIIAKYMESQNAG